MNVKLIAVTFVLIILTASSVFAECQEPEECANQYFEALQDEGMTAIGSFMHPDALKELKDMLLPIYEYIPEESQRQFINLTFGDSVELADIQAMEPLEFTNGFMHFVAVQSGTLKISFDKLEIIGTLEEGDMRHVVARVTVGMDEMALTEYEVLSFVPFENTWRLQLSGEMKGIAQALKANLGQR